MRILSPVQLKETDESFPVRVLLDKPDVSLCNHWHKEIEIIYLLKGSLKIYINGVAHPLKEDDIVFMAGGDIHGADLSLHNVRIVIQFDDCIFENHYLTEQEYAKIRERLNTLTRVSTLWPPEVKDRIRQLIFSLRDEYEIYKNEATPFVKLSIQTLLYELITFSVSNIPVCREQEAKSLHCSRDKLEKLKKVLYYINGNYMEEIALKDAANILNFAPNYFVRFWKAQMGISFHSYLNQVRISIAISMIAENKYQVNEISQRVGFKSAKTFNRVFKEITGTNPGNYKKVYL